MRQIDSTWYELYEDDAVCATDYGIFFISDRNTAIKHLKTARRNFPAAKLGAEKTDICLKYPQRYRFPAKAWG